MIRPPPSSPLFPYPTLFRSARWAALASGLKAGGPTGLQSVDNFLLDGRSEEHTSELQSHVNLVCRLLLEKKKKQRHTVGGRRGQGNLLRVRRATDAKRPTQG